MEKIKIVDTLFSHVEYSTLFQRSKYFTWDRSLVTNEDEIVIYTDNSLQKVNNMVKTKIAWLLESPAVSYYQHQWIQFNYEKFDLVFTNNQELLDLGEIFRFAPTAGCWIKPEDQKIWNKNKLISIIASSKNFTDGHHMRQSIMKENFNIDKFGRGFNFLEYKLDGLKDYMFSIVVENTKKDVYFTEKIIDCFATGTIPIYWGCPSIGKFFDDNGILSFNNIEELKDIINNLSEELYYSKIEYVNDNFERSKKYLIAEDYIYENYIK